MYYIVYRGFRCMCTICSAMHYWVARASNNASRNHFGRSARCTTVPHRAAKDWHRESTYKRTPAPARIRSYAARLKPRTHVLFYTFCFLINIVSMSQCVRLNVHALCKPNPIEISDKDKDPSACTAFSDPCGPLLLKSLYNIEHLYLLRHLAIIVINLTF
jgi:hypothetical protein